jgi:L-ribulose-5-phosphate 3-epimerase
MKRRNFLAAAAPAMFAGSMQGAQASKLPIKKGIVFNMLPRSMSILDRFQLAKDVGFEEIECHTEPDQARAEEFKAASDKTGVPIHSVMNSAHWQYPLSSSDDKVVETSMEGMRTSLRNAKLWGAQTVLLVPAVVNPQTQYKDAWTRSQAQIRKLIPMAADLKVIIAVEEVWNKFLLSPLEMARYVDDFKSPWVKAYFDVGNVVLYGYPQDWIRTLGKRIVKVHLKDFAFRQDPTVKKRVADFVNLRDGEIDWKEIHAALREIGYSGTASVELSGGGKEYLADVVKRFDQILAGV